MNYRSSHEEAIKRVEAEYRRKGYNTIINVAIHPFYIPDLLMLSRKGKPLWVEVENDRDKMSREKLRDLRRDMKLLDGKLRIHYLHNAHGERTNLMKTIRKSVA